MSAYYCKAVYRASNSLCHCTVLSTKSVRGAFGLKLAQLHKWIGSLQSQKLAVRYVILPGMICVSLI